jgi:preprotein translocase subunit SecE
VGRLQRKKQPSQKKKKKKDSSGQTDDSAAQIAVARPKTDTAAPVKKNKPAAGKKSVSVARPSAAKVRDNVFTRSIQFLREVKVELKKVTWPSRKQTLGSTVVVIILVTIISFFLGAVDIGLSALVKLVLR